MVKTMSCALTLATLLAWCLTLAKANPAPGWVTCGGLPDAYNATACPSEATCCTQKWVPAEENYGCCPYPDAVCCGDYTCCPSGSTCQSTGLYWQVVTTCVAANGTAVGPGDDGGGQEVCKTGGPFKFSTTLKNVIILGDSVSIGYTPHVATLMEDVALVQHSPWGGDGGAEETAYGWKCLEYLLSAPDGTPQRPDVLFFNFGLHNINNSTLPGQTGPIDEYAPYLAKIAQRLASLGPQIIFGITSPMMCDAASDAIVQSNNKIAVGIMARYDIPTVNLHDAITRVCGPSPNLNCFNCTKCFCPHDTSSDGRGYDYLAKNVIVPAITDLL